MAYKGIIFDFNGTLFQDTQKHLEAWEEYSARLRGYPFTYEEMLTKMLGRPNEAIIEYALGRKPEKELAEKLAAEKEAVYRKMCLSDPNCLHLTAGAEELLDYLKEKQVPFTIATGSEKTNVDFFIETFNLKKWFDLSKIVYDDGILPGKPNPDIYIKAAENINLNPKDCIIFEDAISGVRAARAANAGKVIVISEKDNFEGADEIIKDFTEFNKEVI